MKRLLSVIVIFTFISPAFADLIDPRITRKDITNSAQLREEQYKRRQYEGTIRRVCGKTGTYTKKECKTKLRKEYKAIEDCLDGYFK